MARDELLYRNQMNSALDNDLSEQELEALHAHLAESAAAAEDWESLQQTDELLRTTPKVAPLPDFVNRVMAAIATMPLPGVAKRYPGIGIALGLAIAALFTVPIFSVLLIVLVSVLTNPGAIHTLLESSVNAAGYVITLLADVAAQLEAATTDPKMLIALVSAMIPVTALWGWLIWNLAGGSRLLKRPKS